MQSVQWIMGTVVWSDVWCENQCIEKTSSGGEQTEDYRLDSWQIATDYILTSADFYLHLAFAIYK